MNRNILDIIEEFNNKNKIEDVIETVAGAHIHKNLYVAHCMAGIAQQEQVYIQETIYLLVGQEIVGKV